MNSALIELLLNGLVAGLLVATIAYAVMLNRRLTHLREAKDDFQKLVRDLNQATAQAEGSVYALKASAKELYSQLHMEIERGQDLKEDLVFMLERSNLAGGKLEKDIAENRAQKRAARKQERSAASAAGSGAGMGVGIGASSSSAAPLRADPKSAPKMGAKPTSKITPSEAAEKFLEDKDLQGQMSEAERDLLKLLKNVR